MVGWSGAQVAGWPGGRPSNHFNNTLSNVAINLWRALHRLVAGVKVPLAAVPVAEIKVPVAAAAASHRLLAGVKVPVV